MADPFSDNKFSLNPQQMIPSRYVPGIFRRLQKEKLPRIEKEKQTLHPRFPAKNTIKSSTKLPNLKLEAVDITKKQAIIQNNTNLLIENIKVRQKSEGDDFAAEIEKKLKIVLANQNPTSYFAEGSDSEEEDFEKKIHKQKQLIKKERLKRESGNDSVCERPINQAQVNLSIQPEKRRQQSILSHQKLSIASSKNRQKMVEKVESIYDRRMRDYKDQSNGNKILAKKKEILKESQQIPSHRKSIQHEQIPNLNFMSIKNKAHEARPNHKKQSKKMIQSMTKDEDLFDNLHNIILNPNRKSESDIVKQKPKKTKAQLEEQLKMLQKKLLEQRTEDLQLLQKLGNIGKREKGNQDLQVTETTLNTSLVKDEQYGSWKKIDGTSAFLDIKRTNFDEQIEKVNKYFQRNEKSLQKYVENQRKLANLHILKKKK